MKKNKNWFLKIIVVLFIVFLGLFVASKSGFYEAKMSKKTLMTNEAIKKFEQDIEEGKPIDLENYFQEDKKDYANFLTKTADKITKACEDVLSGSIKDVWDFFKVLF